MATTKSTLMHDNSALTKTNNQLTKQLLKYKEVDAENKRLVTRVQIMNGDVLRVKKDNEDIAWELRKTNDKLRSAELDLKQEKQNSQKLSNHLFRAKGYIDRVLEKELPDGSVEHLTMGDSSIIRPAVKGPNYEAE